MPHVVDESLFIDQSAVTTKGTREGLNHLGTVRVVVEWAAGVTAGVVTVRWGRQKAAKLEETTLSFSAGKANSVLIGGGIGYVEAEITTLISGGADPKASAFVLGVE